MRTAQWYLNDRLTGHPRRALALWAVAIAASLLVATALGAQTVSPGSITIDPSTACGGGSDTVEDLCIILPEASTCNSADIFLLFDDTGSFEDKVVTAGEIFGSIVADLTSGSPCVDFTFGVGRFEEYGGPGRAFGSPSAFEEDRPFILNQALTRNLLALTAALSDAGTAPGFGGDGPESAIEALFQIATGTGFNGNPDANTSLLDSGAAGIPATWQTPGPSGDVPSFASYTSDVPKIGELGGVGWRPESCLRLVILATDACSVAPFAAGADIPDFITGTGATVPSSTFNCGKRFGFVSDAESQANNTVLGAEAPRGAATVPETVQALNDLGIRVIGLGTNAAPSSDPGPSNDESVFLSALARLTGALDADGEPLVFDLGAGSNGIRNAIVQAVETSLTTPIDIALVPDPELPGLTVTTDPPIREDVGPGDEACFTVTFAGDETFDGGNLGLSFVDAASNGGLGMGLPVNLKCPKCFDLVTLSHLCNADEGGFTGSFEWTFIVRNRAAEDVQHLFFVDLPAGVTIEPQHLTFTPPIKTNQPRRVTVKITGATPGTVLDFRITLHDATLAQCCAKEVELEVPECDCAQLRVDREPRCFGPPFSNIGPPWHYTFDLENLTTVPVDYLLLAPVSPADHLTPISPSELVIDPNVLLLGDTLFGGDETGSITVGLSGPAAKPREEACFRLSTHDATFAQCCSIVKCLTIPDCFFGPVDFDPLGGAALTRSGNVFIVSDIGSSGKDGVAATFGPASEVGISLQDFSLGVPLAEGASVRFGVSGIAAGELVEAANAMATLAQGEVLVYPEGAPGVREILVLLDGEVVASSVQAGIVTAVDGDWPTGFVMIENLEGISAQGMSIQKGGLITSNNIAGVTWSEPVHLQLDNHWQGLGNEVRIFFENPVTVEGLTRAELTAADIPTLVLKRFDFEPEEDTPAP